MVIAEITGSFLFLYIVTLIMCKVGRKSVTK